MNADGQGGLPPNLKRFGRIVHDRRNELGLSQIQVWRAGGPSNSTLTKIEGGLPPVPSNATLRKLDAGLSWASGSARAALAGYSPTPVRDESRPPMQERHLPADEAQVQEAATWLHRRMVQVSRSSETTDDARTVAAELVRIQSATESFIGAIERAIDLDTPRDDVEQAVMGATALYMGSGAYGVLSRSDVGKATHLIQRLGELRSVNDQRPATPSAFDVLTGRINRKEGAGVGRGAASNTPAGVSPADNVGAFARPEQSPGAWAAREGNDERLSHGDAAEGSQDPGSDEPA